MYASSLCRCVSSPWMPYFLGGLARFRVIRNFDFDDHHKFDLMGHYWPRLISEGGEPGVDLKLALKFRRVRAGHSSGWAAKCCPSLRLQGACLLPGLPSLAASCGVAAIFS